MMKKNLLIAFLVIVSIASLIFGYTQKQKADEQKSLAEEYAILLEVRKRQLELTYELAAEQRQIAEKEAERARKLHVEAESLRKNK